MDNTIVLVRDTLLAWEALGVTLDLFGGWAEELLGLREPGPHSDIDLVYRGANFACVDAVLRSDANRFIEVREKRFHHKRAFHTGGVLCEILLVQDWETAPLTLFWGDTPFLWEKPFLALPEDHDEPILSIVARNNLALYRAAFKSTQNHRWLDPAVRVS